MRKIIVTINLMLIGITFASNYTPWEVPTGLEIVGGGAVVSGPFGDPNACEGYQNRVFIEDDGSGSFNAKISVILTALTTKKEIRIASNSCIVVPTHGYTVSKNNGNQAVYIR